MLKISTKGQYGLRAMTELARRYGRGPISLTEIAESEHLPLAYLEQLMVALRKEGLVEGTRGSRGGYRLAQDPDRLTVGQVIKALEGPIAPVECTSDVYLPGSCQREPGCVSRFVWQRMKTNIERVLDATSLGDLCRDGGEGDMLVHAGFEVESGAGRTGLNSEKGGC